MFIALVLKELGLGIKFKQNFYELVTNYDYVKFCTCLSEVI